MCEDNKLCTHSHMPNILTRLILFLSSYAPLFVIIAMRGWRESRHFAIGLVIVAVLSVVALLPFSALLKSYRTAK